jgi:hypothetical protein
MRKKLKRMCEVCGKIGYSDEIQILRKASMMLCKKHHHQYDNYGYFLDSNERTVDDKNEIVLYDEYAEIILYNVRSEEIARTKIDLDDVDKVSNIKWCHSSGRCIGDTNNGGILLSRFVMNVEDSKIIVDHINRKPLDNRKNNLRLCTIKENSYNASLAKNNTSGIMGVYWDKSRNKFASNISPNDKKVYLGRFENIEDAIIARLKAELFYFGDFAPQKHLFEKYGID